MIIRLFVLVTVNISALFVSYCLCGLISFGETTARTSAAGCSSGAVADLEGFPGIPRNPPFADPSSVR